MIGALIEKLTPDPQQVPITLLSQRYSRPDPGVDEQVAAHQALAAQRAQKAEMAGGHNFAQGQLGVDQISLDAAGGSQLHSVTVRSGVATEL